MKVKITGLGMVTFRAACVASFVRSGYEVGATPAQWRRINKHLPIR